MNSFFGQNINNLDLMLCIMESGVVNLVLKKGRICILLDLMDHLLYVKHDSV